MTLCALSDVKALLDIPTIDTSKDAKISLLIAQVSSLVSSYLGYDPQRKVVTSELHAVNGRQYLQLNRQPIQSIESVLLQGSPVTDYQTDEQDLAVGMLYRGAGWCGTYYTRNMTGDPFAGAREILVSYTAGWWLPGDAEFTMFAPDSLPVEIQTAVIGEVIRAYRANVRGSEGLKAHSEGGISDTFADASAGIGKALSDTARSALSGFVRIVIA